MGTTAFFFMTTMLLSILAARKCIRRQCNRNATDPDPDSDPDSDQVYVDNVIPPNFIPPKPSQAEVATRGKASLEPVYDNRELYEL